MAVYHQSTLSRAYLKETSDSSNTTDEIESINMIDELPISEERISELQEHTRKDQQMQELKEVIQEGWPNNKWNVPSNVSIYFDIRDELTLQNGLLFKGERVIIPKSLRTRMIKKIHSSHIGIEGCLRRARESLYWPGMNAEVKDYIQRCETCRTFERKQQKETLISHEIPSRPWSKVGIDLMTFQSKNYLVTVDYYSNYWEVDYLEDTLALTVIRKLRAQFARHGIPDVCFTDNGPQFDCGEFRKFSNFKHDTSSPLYAQSNGKVEQTVQTVQRLMKKSKFDKKDPYLAFLDFRNTPTEGFDNSPAEKLMNRKTRTPLPTKESLLKPKVITPNKVQTELTKQKQKQQFYYNQGTKDLPMLKNGDTVRIQPSNFNKEWKKGTIKQQVNIRSYEVDVGARTIHRNRLQLKHTLEDDNNEPTEIERDNSDF
ncbi:Hypothetical predicted protein [Mytilus galloprovincialis]|uniref:Integrase catalytic domain-containing protein n=2 Tax=Mytilus galloprovincialis TaxID=29158 RepID=A0A8B6GB45_MYTGA|nr:Hypothetical predicted protein [Mytilus galloprovincialis]